MSTAVLAGATGLVGGQLLQRLLKDPLYDRVIAIARRSLPAHPKLETRGFDRLDFPSDGDLFCALGTTIKKAGSQEAFRSVDYDLPLTLARTGGRQYILVSSVDANPKSANFYLRTKGELEQAISGLPFEAVHVFRPSLLLGHRQELRMTERISTQFASAVQFALIGSWRRYRPIQASTVASAMLAAAKSRTPGRHIYHFDEIQSLALRA